MQIIYRFAFELLILLVFLKSFELDCFALLMQGLTITKCFAFILWIATILRIAKSCNDDSWYRLLRIAFVMQDLQVATQ